jgi:hypothetical protein
MKLFSQRYLVAVLVVAAGWMQAERGWAEKRDPSTAHSCASYLQTDVPHALITNGLIEAVVYPPDPQHGYYRSSRFDWAGVIPCLAYKGHTYFGPWKFPHDPLVNDSISGPVEEFRSEDGGLGYGEAQPGGLFVKPGVGVLRKVSDTPYTFQFVYPILDTGKWTVHAERSAISFTQHLNSAIGYAYVYTKTLQLENGQPVMVIHHHMKNTGTRIIDTDVYDHDFFRLDNAPTGPAMVIHFAFAPKAVKPLQNGGEIMGKDLVFHRELQSGEQVTSFLTGFSGNVSDYGFTVENRDTGAGVKQWGDSPISNFNFWSVRTTIAPEAYVHLHILPGQTQDWTIRYLFLAK